MIEAMTLQNIDIVQSETLERTLDRGKDPFSTQAFMVRPSRRTLFLECALGAKGLGEDDDGFSRDRVLFEELADNDLGFTGRVDVGRVKGLRQSVSVELGG